MIGVREINDIQSLDSYRAQWAGLLGQTRGASFFQSLDWLQCYWRHFGQEQRLRALVVERDEQCLGIVPLTVRAEPTRVGRLRVLTYPLHDWGTFYSPIGSETAIVLQAGLEHVKRTPRDWDLLELRWIDEAGIDGGATRQALETVGLAARRGAWQACAQVEITGTWEDYWASRTSHWRNNVRRSEKRLGQAGSIEYQRYRPAGTGPGEVRPRWDVYDACEQVARESWQAASQSGTTLTHETIRPFLRDVHEAAERTGNLDVNLLYLAGRPVAFNYAYHHRGVVHGLRTGYCCDPAAGGAGTVLQMHMIRDSFERGDQLYDLGIGYLDCKRSWQTRVAHSYRYTHFPRAVRPQIVRAKRAVAGWFTRGQGSRGTEGPRPK